MVKHAARELKIGLIIERTMKAIEANIVPALLYLALITIAGTGAAWFGVDAPMRAGLLSLAQSVVTIAATFFLLDTMLKNCGFVARETEANFLAYFGLSILVTLGVGLGLILLIVPGLIFMARWSIAQPLVMAENGKVIDSMRKSWDLTRGNEFPIIVASLTMTILFVGTGIAVNFMFAEQTVLTIGIAQLAGALSSVISVGLATALYGLICDPKKDAATFE